MALDDHTRRLLATLSSAGDPPVHKQDITAARLSMRSRQTANAPGPAMADVTEARIITGRDEPLIARVFEPEQARPGIIIYFHGGGWVMGDLDGFDALARRIADATRLRTFLVDYRLAPEHPFPSAVHDAWDALRSVRESAPAEVPVIVAGDSSGANLAAAVAQRAFDEGIDVTAQILVYPVLDADFTRDSYLDPENQLLVSRDSMMWFWQHYLPPEEQRVETAAAPLRRPELTGLPPAVVLTAEHDVLRDEGEEYARRLQDAGVPVQHRRFDGQMHGFLGMPLLPASGEALGFLSEALNSLLELPVEQH